MSPTAASGIPFQNANRDIIFVVEIGHQGDASGLKALLAG